MERLYNEKYLKYTTDEEGNVTEVFLSDNESNGNDNTVTLRKVYSPVILEGEHANIYGYEHRGTTSIIPIGIKEFPQHGRAVKDIRIYGEISGRYTRSGYGYEQDFQSVDLINGDKFLYSNMTGEYLSIFNSTSDFSSVLVTVGLEVRVKTKDGMKWLRVQDSEDTYRADNLEGNTKKTTVLKKFSFAKQHDYKSDSGVVNLTDGVHTISSSLSYHSEDNIMIEDIIIPGGVDLNIFVIPREEVIKQSRSAVDFNPWNRRADMEMDVSLKTVDVEKDIQVKNGVMQTVTLYTRTRSIDNVLDMKWNENLRLGVDGFNEVIFDLEGYATANKPITAFNIETDVNYNSVKITNGKNNFMHDSFEEGVEEVVYVIEGKPVNSSEINELAVFSRSSTFKTLEVVKDKLKVYYESLRLSFYVKMKSGIVINNDTPLEFRIGEVYKVPEYNITIEEEGFYNTIEIRRPLEKEQELKNDDGNIVIEVETSIDKEKLRRNNFNSEVVSVTDGLLKPNKFIKLNDFNVPHGYYYRYRIRVYGVNGKVTHLLLTDIKKDNNEGSILFNAVTKEVLDEHNITNITKNRTQDKELLKFIGRKRPVVDQGTNIEESYVFTSSFFDFKERLKLLDILQEGSLLGYKDEFGNVIIGVLSNLSESENYDPLRFDLTYTLEGVDYHAK